MKLKITAIDTLFFKDGKPFSRGEETWADGFFPPPPSVFYGALRTLYFSYYPEKLVDISNQDPTKKLEINEILFCHDDEPYFPIPCDIVEQDEPMDEVLQFLEPKLREQASSHPLGQVLTAKKERVESLEGKSLIGKTNFLSRYFNGNCPNSKLDIVELTTKEPKVGIGRNDITNSTDEGLLYRVDMRRLKDEEGNTLDFFIDFDFPELEEVINDEGIIKLGGENKVAQFRQQDYDYRAKSIQEVNKFKIVLVTSAIFENGWYPDFLDDRYQGKLDNVDVKLVAAAIGKPLSIGGFDMQEGRPKPMFRAVPPGSVYYFESSFPISIDNESFKLNSLKSKEGFGIAYYAKSH